MLRLTVLTFNMQSGQVWDPKNPDGAPFDMNQSVSFIKSRDADIVFLQEVEFPDGDFPDKTKHPNYDILRESLSGYYSCFAYPAATRAHLPFGIGLAIFSKFPLEEDFHLVLPASDVGFEFKGRQWLPAERSLIGATINVEGQTVSLLNTHLQAYFMIDASADDHTEQRDIVATLVRGRKHPTILGGDFNCAPKEATLAVIESAGVKSLQKKKTTWHRMPVTPDHIFHSAEFGVESAGVIETDASDHDAVEGIFTLTNHD